MSFVPPDRLKIEGKFKKKKEKQNITLKRRVPNHNLPGSEEMLPDFDVVFT